MPKYPISEDVILRSGSSIENLKGAIDAGDAIIGVIKYVTASSDYQFYNGTKWVSMSGFKSANKNDDTTDTFGVLEGLSTDGATYEFRSIKKGSSKITMTNSDGIITIDLGTVAISDITDLQDALDNKVDKVAGKGLSTEDFTPSLKDKLSSIKIVKKATPNTDQSATYELQATFGDSTQTLGVGIDISKDMIIQSGTVGTVTVADEPYTGAVVGDKYIDLLLANSADTHIYIPANSLMDIYTGGDTTEITVTVNNTTNVITASIVDSSIKLTKLADITLGSITASEIQVDSTEAELLSILQTYAKNIKALLAFKTSLDLQNTYVSPPLTGQGGTITAATHGVINPKLVLATLAGANMIIYTKIDVTTKNVTWSSKTNFIAGDNAIITIIG